MKIRFVVSFHETAWKSFLDIFVRHFSLGIFSPQRKCRLWSEKTDRCSPLPRTRRRAARSAGNSSFSSSRPSSSSFRSLLLLPRTTSTTNERHHHHQHRHRSTRRHSSTPSLPEGRKRDERSARKSPTSGSSTQRARAWRERQAEPAGRLV